MSEQFVFLIYCRSNVKNMVFCSHLIDRIVDGWVLCHESIIPLVCGFHDKGHLPCYVFNVNFVK